MLKFYVFGKLLTKGNILAKILLDDKLFSVGKHFVDIKHLASIKMVTDLTYLPNDEKLDWCA